MQKVIGTMVLLSVVLCGSMRGQNSTSEPSAEKRPSACHLEFSLNELEDGRKTNVRRYSLNLTGGNEHELKIGTRVPIESEQGKFVYLDIGTYIRSKIYGNEDAPILDVTAEVSSLAVADPSARGGQPIVRQMIISASTTLLFDKTMTIGAVDDPNSKRQYQLEVTAAKIK